MNLYPRAGSSVRWQCSRKRAVVRRQRGRGRGRARRRTRRAPSCARGWPRPSGWCGACAPTPSASDARYWRRRPAPSLTYCLTEPPRDTHTYVSRPRRATITELRSIRRMRFTCDHLLHNRNPFWSTRLLKGHLKPKQLLTTKIRTCNGNQSTAIWNYSNILFTCSDNF